MQQKRIIQDKTEQEVRKLTMTKKKKYQKDL